VYFDGIVKGKKSAKQRVHAGVDQTACCLGAVSAGCDISLPRLVRVVKIVLINNINLVL